MNTKLKAIFLGTTAGLALLAGAGAARADDTQGPSTQAPYAQCEFYETVGGLSRSCAVAAVECDEFSGRDCEQTIEVTCENGEGFSGTWTEHKEPGVKRIFMDADGDKGVRECPSVEVTPDMGGGNPSVLHFRGRDLGGFCVMETGGDGG